ncbi:hypothetical protein QQY24_06015 [Streptomyces sp. TG1A-8]|nr:hypothetical protein [Streptomyces sp. TG1A-8]MDO0924992.1 hypothetical protein [Streptomyces sp. TG1A-8]
MLGSNKEAVAHATLPEAADAAETVASVVTRPPRAAVGEVVPWPDGSVE